MNGSLLILEWNW